MTLKISYILSFIIIISFIIFLIYVPLRRKKIYNATFVNIQKEVKINGSLH